MCGSVGTLDSFLMVRSASCTVLNVNGCEISPWVTRTVARSIGSVNDCDLLPCILRRSGSPSSSLGGFGTLEVSGRYTRINPKINTLALYLCLCHLSSLDIHFQGLGRRLLQRRVWSFCRTKWHEVLGRLLSEK